MWEEGETYRRGSWEVMRAKQVGAAIRVVASVLVEELKVHRILLLWVECMVV